MKAKHGLWIAAIALTATLTACGGSSSSNNNGGDTGTSPPPVTLIDTFTQFVLNLVGTSADTSEPQAIDSVTVTAPENSEPVTTS
ncbi:hypothetical protein QN372_18940 [Undibacterium sp. RTI2.1]|uniref:hypothetical protein n=1 Tax=unclassified Undibacterium TaxID=2630295 RepID=UPI002AB32AE8|nr:MULTISPECIES: hypothetical protein [unclassified Undibacterium]MDY7540000.1 hypothetical protein [Undibacterium sp. 5I1]MEB0032828.1 hypothetical protein [Undibacterium sp. RTI2.1]MEB0116512.1 hypothetical protein [Undibacterium sp. RTI2.2]MEB0232361.1 hypothetical protein [Undibacterium sp. 10I3]MEB0257847.1 hypothetical protein [Undibacterium sp. 5I1]